jgi:hypothetical protein
VIFKSLGFMYRLLVGVLTLIFALMWEGRTLHM